MSFKEVASLDADTTVSIGGKDKKTGKANPTQVEGYYLGKRTVAGTGRFKKESNLHFFQTSKGNLGVWGKTDSDRKLAGITPGTMVRLTHAGMVPTPNGDMHKYKVEVDTDNTIDVDTLPSGNSSVSDSGGAWSGGAESDDEDLNEETEEQDDDESTVPVIAASSAAERKAKVQALLNRKSK